MEEWRDIQGYEGLYQVSSCGRVKTLNYKRTGQERIMKQVTNSGGYKFVNLYKNGEKKYYQVHRLVATAFIDNPNNYPCVNHKDECKYNNFVENLEFCTHEYNVNYGTRTERQSRTLTGKYIGENNPMYGRTGKKHPMYGKHHSDETRKKITKNHADVSGKNNPRARRIMCINTGKIFDTVGEAAKWSSTGISSIARQIQGKQKTSGKNPVTKEKLQWKYID